MAPAATGVGAAVVQGTPLSERSISRRALNMASGPKVDETKQKTQCDLLINAAFQSILPLIFIIPYYRDDWASRYCETTIAEWAFVFGWIGAACVPYTYLVNVWLWRLKWQTFVASNEASRKKILKRYNQLSSPLPMAMIASLVWFIIGQVRIRPHRFHEPCSALLNPYTLALSNSSARVP